MAELSVDDELKIPVYFRSFDWPAEEGGKPRLLEEYFYKRVKLNVGLTDLDFDRHNPEYHFQLRDESEPVAADDRRRRPVRAKTRRRTRKRKQTKTKMRPHCPRRWTSSRMPKHRHGGKSLVRSDTQRIRQLARMPDLPPGMPERHPAARTCRDGPPASRVPARPGNQPLRPHPHTPG